MHNDIKNWQKINKIEQGVISNQFKIYSKNKTKCQSTEFRSRKKYGFICFYVYDYFRLYFCAYRMTHANVTQQSKKKM